LKFFGQTGSFSRTLVNLGIVKAEVDKGVTDPTIIFSDKSVDAVTRAWRALRVQGTQYHYPKALVKFKPKTSVDNS
jgi:hypothetical protein